MEGFWNRDVVKNVGKVVLQLLVTPEIYLDDSMTSFSPFTINTKEQHY